MIAQTVQQSVTPVIRKLIENYGDALSERFGLAQHADHWLRAPRSTTRASSAAATSRPPGATQSRCRPTARPSSSRWITLPYSGFTRMPPERIGRCSTLFKLKALLACGCGPSAIRTAQCLRGPRLCL
eukprot:UN2322